MKRDPTGRRFSSIQVAVTPATEGRRGEVASQAHKSLRSTGPATVVLGG